MYTYLQKDTVNIYAEFDFLLDENYEVGATYNDYESGKWVLLSSQQFAFREAHPEASVQEVFEMKLNEMPEPPEPPKPPVPDNLEAAKQQKLAEIIKQDKFSEKFFVSVTLGGVEVANVELWANSALRTSLLGSTLPAEASDGKTTTTLWSTTTPSQPLEVPIEWAKKNLLVLEIYAKRTYDLMQINNNATLAATTVEEIAHIDVKANYPKFLTFELNLDLE